MKILTTGALLLASLCLVLPIHEAKAMGCQGIDGHGHCVDAKTVEWCDDGVLQTAKCPENEICAKHDDYGDGYLCIAKDLTACAGVPDEGMCESEKQAVWCVEGELTTKECGVDELCGHDHDHGWVDCVPVGELPPEPRGQSPEDQESDASDGAGDSSDETFSEGADSVSHADTMAPTPNVTEGKPWSADEPDGCKAGGSSSLPVWLVAVLGVFFLRRERFIG